MLEAFTKKEICASIAAVIFIFLGLLWIYDYPGTTEFVCSRPKNICTLSSANVFGYKFTDTIQFDKIINTDIEEESSSKHTAGTKYSSHKYYYYNWVAYYNDNGAVEKFPIFRTTDYEYHPADKLYDRQYRYFEDVKRLFNGFLEDKSKSRFYAPIYESKLVKKTFWEDIFYTTFVLAGMLVMLYLVILFIDPASLFKEIIKFFKH